MTLRCGNEHFAVELEAGAVQIQTPVKRSSESLQPAVDVIDLRSK